MKPAKIKAGDLFILRGDGIYRAYGPTTTQNYSTHYGPYNAISCERLKKFSKGSETGVIGIDVAHEDVRKASPKESILLSLKD